MVSMSSAIRVFRVFVRSKLSQICSCAFVWVRGSRVPAQADWNHEPTRKYANKTEHRNSIVKIPETSLVRVYSLIGLRNLRKHTEGTELLVDRCQNTLCARLTLRRKLSKSMREQLVNLILERLDRESDRIKNDFAADKGIPTRFTAIDDLLPKEIAERISAAFPPVDNMRLLDSFREKKYTSKALDKFDPLIEDITFAFQDDRVINKVAELTGIKDAVGDPHLYAGGISAMARGHFLNPHIDNSHDGDQKNYRVLNLLYYITPNWKSENGGNLELWDEGVTRRVEIPSLFNRNSTKDVCREG